MTLLTLDFIFRRCEFFGACFDVGQVRFTDRKVFVNEQ